MARRSKQKRIPGTYDPEEQQVQEAAEEYVTLLHKRMKLQEQENVARDDLLTTMREHDIMECEVDGYRVTRVSSEQEKIKVKKLSEEATVAVE